MKQVRARYKDVFYVLLVMALLMPTIVKRARLFEERPLKGAFTKAEDPYISKSAWLSGEYQQKQEAFLNENFAFRSEFVRLYNQWHYNLFNEVKANGVILGKENTLYEENYIKAYTGVDYVGEDVIRENARKLKIISDTLQGMGKQLLVVLAPGKGSYYPEFIPEVYLTAGKRNANVKGYSRELVKMGVEVFDANAWFRSLKPVSDHTLYARTGIHWTTYGQTLVVDSLLRRTETLVHAHLPKLKIESVDKTHTPRNYDDDIQQGMNLLLGIPERELLSYPKCKLEGLDEMDSVRLLTIGDSYFWELFESHLMHSAFPGNQFWYYNEEAHTAGVPGVLLVRDINFKQAIEQTDLIILLCTDSNLPRFGFGFVERFCEIYGIK